MSINKVDILGTFNEQLDESLLNEIEKMYKKITPTSEFEFMFFKNEMMYAEYFIKILKYLSAKSKRDKLPIHNIVTLDINYTASNSDTYRVSVNTQKSINNVIKLLHNRNNHVIFSTLVKLHEKDDTITIMKKSKNLKNVITIDEFDMKLRLAEETSVTKKEIEELSNLNDTVQKNIIFRYKQRVSLQIEKSKDATLSIDLTNIKQSKNINTIEKAIPAYELEIDLSAKKENLPKTILTNIYSIITTLIKIIQESNFIIKKSLQKEVLVAYANLWNMDPKKLTKLEGRQPESLEIQHAVDQLPNKYAVTDKADGERYALITYKNVTFLISKLLHVKNTGIILDKKVEKYNNTLLDGELIFINSEGRHIFMCFDCMYFCNKDTKEISLLQERLKCADELIENCYLLGSQTGYKIGEYTKKFDIEDVIKFYSNDITEFMKALNGDIKKEKAYPLIRRKYFIFSQGAQPNEIFRYASLIWEKYTKDKNVHCPYLLDGEITQPVDQKYITGKLSKFRDYKWKPNEKNSIDFYVLYERDKKTGNIVNLYDNSDVADNTQVPKDESVPMGSVISTQLANKPYKILNLYVGKSIKGVETPIPFEPEKDSVKNLAYLFLQDGEVRDISGNIIQDGTVVEFYYNTDSSVPDKYRWVPIKTRYDKTEAVYRYKMNYGNYFTVANMVWRSIKNPFTMDDINILSQDAMYAKHNNILRGKIDHSIILSERQENEYFQIKSRLAKPMRNFNNWVKSVLIYTYINSVYEKDGRQLSAMDIGCGKGLDIMKYYYGKVEFCINIDPDINLLLSPVDGAVSRYNQLKKTHPNFPRMYFIHADASVLLNYEEQNIVLGGMSDQNKEFMIKLFSSGNKMKVDRINCEKTQQFLENNTTWGNFCSNINDFLNPGGYFMGTAFDADAIIKILEGKKNYSVYYTNTNGEQSMLFDIVKKYNNVVHDDVGTGISIDYHNSLDMQEGTYTMEHLVQIKFLEKEFLEKCDMELVDSGLFADLFVMNKDFFTDVYKYESKAETKKFFTDVAEYFSDTSELNAACKKLTGLLRYFVFRKKDKNSTIPSKKQKGGDPKFVDSKITINTKNLTKRGFPNVDEYSFFTCIHNVLQNNKIIPNGYSMDELYRDTNIEMCKDNIISEPIIENLKNNLIIKHEYEGGSDIAFNGVNIIINKNNNKFEILGKLNKSQPTILLHHDGNKYNALYEKNSGLFHTNRKFIKDIVKNI
jgi:SAM-dependent methyltransferase